MNTMHAYMACPRGKIMSSIKEMVIQKMAALGVEEKDIFLEMMRARHLDVVIFSDRANVDNGLTQEELYRAAVKLTADSLGPVPGNEDTYAYIYTVAMSADPLLFAPHLPQLSLMKKAILRHAIEAAEKGKTVLFAGADAYLAMLTEIFVSLKGRRIAVTVSDGDWQQRIHWIYGRGRSMLAEDVYTDTESYDYIFFAAEGREGDGQLWTALRKHLAPEGTLEVYAAEGFLDGDGKQEASDEVGMHRISSFYDVVDEETEAALVRSGPAEQEGTISIGEAALDEGVLHFYKKLSMTRENFAAADSWDYDLYVYNGNQALQTILSAGLLDPDFSVGSVFKENKAMKGTLGTYPIIEKDAVTEAGIRLDLVQENVVGDVKRAEEGDLVLCDKEGRLSCAVVPKVLHGAAVGKGIFVFHPFDAYSAEYLKAYLDGPIGQLFLSTMRAGKDYCLCGSRLLRVPMPKASEAAIQEITVHVKLVTEHLMEAEEDWRKAKLDAINRMMKKD